MRPRRIKMKKKLSISDLLPLKMLFLLRVWVTDLDPAIYMYTGTKQFSN